MASHRKALSWLGDTFYYYSRFIPLLIDKCCSFSLFPDEAGFKLFHTAVFYRNLHKKQGIPPVFGKPFVDITKFLIGYAAPALTLDQFPQELTWRGVTIPEVQALLLCLKKKVTPEDVKLIKKNKEEILETVCFLPDELAKPALEAVLAEQPTKEQRSHPFRMVMYGARGLFSIGDMAFFDTVPDPTSNMIDQCRTAYLLRFGFDGAQLTYEERMQGVETIQAYRDRFLF